MGRFNYAVFTVMTPDLTLEETAKALADAGYDGVEWRVAAPPKDPSAKPDYWAANRATVDAARLKELAPEIAALSRRHGLEIPALGTYLNAGDTAAVEAAMEGAKAMGVPCLRVGIPSYDGKRNYNEVFTEGQRQFEKVVALAEKHRRRVLTEIHHGSITPSAAYAHRFVSRFDPRWIGCIYDPGNMVHEGIENWRMGMELLGPYLAHVHVKNARWERDKPSDQGTRWKASWAPVTDGVVWWPDVVAALKAVNYHGWLSFEDFSPGDTREKLKTNLAALKAAE
jgi:sugar phosphate isomerase/epimerase